MVLVGIAASQAYFYGMSYLVDGSAIFLPLGIMSLVLNSHQSWNFGSIVKTAKQFELFLSSFQDEEERNLIASRMKERKRTVLQIVLIIEFYLMAPLICHAISMTLHYYGFLKKPVLIPLLFEMFLEGNYELGPKLIATAVVSVFYVYLVANIVTMILLNIHFLGLVVACLEVLTERLKGFAEKTQEGYGKLKEELDLRDTIQQHADLLHIINSFNSWNGFLVTFCLAACSITFCLDALTTKRALDQEIYSGACLWGSFLLVMMVLSYLICDSGSQIETKSEELLRAVYNLPWYRGSSETRKAVWMMLTQGNRLIILNYKELMDLNMVTYLEMLKRAYSYFMILSSIE
ncbi:hypothetical protein GE061_010142 [Apolygus lucorum]|uniref:Odorant receptor n=1 Tax=Apolygus lucorum TaxID=248454 RepID=A0A8S9Y291_APOLU|nr:hypothetical protein GE061_010142 [Apolygus lucorum]